MSLKEIFLNVPLRLRFYKVICRTYCSKSGNILEVSEEEPIYGEEKFDITKKEEKRNKSRLSPMHRNILFNKKPYDEAITWFHNTVRYKKRMLGRYGMELGTSAGFLWPTREEVEEQKEYEKIAYPLSIQERLQKIKKEKKEKEEELIAKQEKIAAKMVGMNQLIINVQQKIAKKKEEEEAAILKKQMMIEKIRHDLIAQGHMSKSKLQEALDNLEQDEKKKKKEAKKAKEVEKQKRVVEYLRKQYIAEMQEVEDKKKDDD